MPFELIECDFSGLRQQMAKYGHTQTKLAELMGVQVPYVNRRFKGRAKWNVSDMKKCSEIYGVPMDELFH